VEQDRQSLSDLDYWRKLTDEAPNTVNSWSTTASSWSITTRRTQIRRRLLGELFLQQALRVGTSSDRHRHVPFLESVVRDYSKDHAVAIATPGDTLTALPIHHIAVRHFPLGSDQEERRVC
jgi:hypothetical protein